ncbi:hypothetical protein LK459_07500 [Gordonia otitidis]|uniref:hypothetical protein n=1 Tax=Gordonia otitidis TaxID=249058 RepID=UPI001D149235|nr:hypothetical protein [Gordonia otitidis]UEA60668.1 hypothetical protein LK459_07500 [Gordonia otitidis]
MILGDPQRRARYDQQLDDPAAPPITEATLAALSGRPAPTAPRRVLSKPVAALVAITAVVVVIALVGIIVALTSGGDDKSTTNAANPGAGQSSAFRCWVDETSSRYENIDGLRQAKWDETWTRNGSRQPTRVVMLTDQYDLPPQLSALVTQVADLSDPIDAVRLTQYADKNVGVGAGRLGANSVNAPANETLSIFDQSGRVVSTATYSGQTFGNQPAAEATANDYGYYRIEAKSGIDIPAAAKGQQKNQTAALSILRDQFDNTKLWVLLLGGTKLYRATLFASDDWTKLGQSADVSHCEPK